MTAAARLWPHRILLLALAVSVPILLYIYTAYVHPRPYFITLIDIEQDYYYNARLLFFARPLFDGLHHPGTPIYYLGDLIMRLTTSNLSGAQAFFNTAYFFAAILTALGASIAVTVAIGQVPFGIACLSLASAFAWPTYLSYVNYFGADSFVLAAGLPTIAVVWLALSSARGWSYGKRWIVWVIAAIGLGLGVAIKVTMLPIAVASWLAAAIDLLLRSEHQPRSVNPFESWIRGGMAITAPVVTLATFAICTWPIHSRWPDFLLLTLSRGDARPTLLGLSIGIAALFSGGAAYALLALGVVTTSTLVAAVGLVSYVTQTVKRLLRMKSADSDGMPYHLPTDVFLVSAGVLFFYCLASSNLYADPGISLRNTAASALMLPFGILYLYVRAVSRPGLFDSRRAVWLHVSVALAALLTAFSSTDTFATNRSLLLEAKAQQVNTTQRTLLALSPDIRRLAIWDRASDLYGEAAFHLWGNYRYAHDEFDQELLSRYSDYAFFRFREADVILNPAHLHYPYLPYPYIETAPVPAIVKSAYWWWNAKFGGSPYGPRTGELFVGEQTYAIDVVAFPTSEAYDPHSQDSQMLLNLVAKRIGAPCISENSIIGGVEWTILKISGGLGCAAFQANEK